MNTQKIITSILYISIISLSFNAFSQNKGMPDVNDIDKILSEKDRAEVVNGWLKWRLENILPRVMEREGIDMWVVINREYNEDPVYMTLVPRPTMYARRTSMLIFHYVDGKVERYTGSFYDMGQWYSSVYSDKKADQFEAVAKFIKGKNPNKVGLNFSETWAFGDGISSSHKKQMENALGAEYSKKVVSAEKLALGWLEIRSPEELSVYRHIVGIAHDIIKEFFSNKIITPDITTTDDVEWWVRQKITDLGLDTWFHPSIDIQRSPEESKKYADSNFVIRRGDVLHCDIGIMYLGLATDTQQMAYVAKIGEEDVPEGLKEALKRANRVQDILMSNISEGRTGNEILLASLTKAKSEGLKPTIYTHPIGFNGHAAGPPIGMWDKQEGVPVRGDYPVHLNTAYSIELGNRYNIPEWGNFEVNIPLEEDAAYTKNGCKMIDGRQEKWHIIK